MHLFIPPWAHCPLPKFLCVPSRPLSPYASSVSPRAHCPLTPSKVPLCPLLARDRVWLCSARMAGGRGLVRNGWVHAIQSSSVSLNTHCPHTPSKIPLCPLAPTVPLRLPKFLCVPSRHPKFLCVPSRHPKFFCVPSRHPKFLCVPSRHPKFLCPHTPSKIPLCVPLCPVTFQSFCVPSRPLSPTTSKSYKSTSLSPCAHYVHHVPYIMYFHCHIQHTLQYADQHASKHIIHKHLSMLTCSYICTYIATFSTLHSADQHASKHIIHKRLSHQGLHPIPCMQAEIRSSNKVGKVCTSSTK